MPRGRPSRQQIFESLDRAQSDLQIIGGLPEPTVFADVWSDIWKEETHNSTAIEGNTLRLRQVQMLLDEGVVSGGSNDLREWLEVKAYAEAARWVYHHAFAGRYERPEIRITESDLRRIHQLVVESVWAHFPPDGLLPKETPGAYRLKEIDPLRPGLTNPPCSAIGASLSNWIESANDRYDEYDGHIIQRLAELHAAFERIHPFPDGNGRVGRLVLSLLLVRSGYPPGVIHKDERSKYLDGLQRADEGDADPLAELLARAVRDGIHRFLMPALAGPLSVVPLSGLANDEISRSALTAAAQRGRLKANKYPGGWYSTRQWVDEYLASRYRRK